MTSPTTPSTVRSDWSVARRLGFGVILTAAMMAGTFPGYVFGVLAPQLVVEFELTRVQLGVLTAVFFLVGGTLSLAAGLGVDRYGARRVMLASFAVVAGALAAMASAGSYGVLVAAAAAAGIALAAGNPVTNKLIATHIQPGRRGLIMGSKQAGVQIGAFVAGFILVPVAIEVGWRMALLLSAVAPVFAFALTRLVVPPDSSAEDDGHPTADASMGPGLRGLALYAFFMGSGIAAVNTYMPLYLVETAGASAAEAGAAVAIVGFVGIVSRVAWGFGIERLRSYSAPLGVLAGGAVLGIAAMTASSEFGLWVAFLAAALLGATAMTWNSVGMLAVLALSGTRRAGRASGIVLFGFYIGFVASPVAFGYLVDESTTYGWGWMFVAGAFVCASVIGARAGLPVGGSTAVHAS